VNFPTHMLPETSARTMTGLVKGYLRPAAKLRTTSNGSSLQVLLTEEGGAPLGGATLVIEVQKKTGLGEPDNAHLSGIVPSGARSALFGVRINMECNCQGESSIGLTLAKYQELGSPAAIKRGFSSGLNGWRFAGTAAHEITMGDNGSQILRIQARPQQTAMLNSAPFEVSPGASFEADVRLQVQPGSEGSGHVALIFLDAGGKEIVRTSLPLQSAWRTTRRAVTDASGSFALTSGAYGNDTSVRVTFPGDNQHRPAGLPLH